MNHFEKASKSIGIVLPVYNGASYIAGAIESVLEQDSTPDEFIVFDNKSTDSTPEILREYQKISPFTVVTANKHLPRMVDSWNFAVDQLSTDWFHLLSADDILRSTFIKHFRAHIADEFAAISMLSEEINQRDQVTLAKFSIGNSHVVEGAALVLENLFSSSINVASVVVNKTAWKEINGYPNEYSYWHDMVFWQRLASVGSVKKVNQVVARYRTYEGEQKSSTRKAGIEEDRALYMSAELPRLSRTWSIELPNSSSSKTRSVRQVLRRTTVVALSQFIKCLYKLGVAKW